ncbi:MAG: amidohydrolase family protein [Rhodopseudomonas palustris]|nr:amidohydrolase family protein [Rhodopseudomonas palustris]
MSPPLRESHHGEALWSAIADGTIDTVGTDHCPFTHKQKRFGVSDFRAIPNGVNGVFERFLLLYTRGFLGGRIDLPRLTGLLSTVSARIFGLSPRKGTIAPGADADVVLFDPAAESTLSKTNPWSSCDCGIYDGIPIGGAIHTVIKAGKIVFENGSISRGAKPGRYLSRRPEKT